jgi:hypothetical protein
VSRAKTASSFGCGKQARSFLQKRPKKLFSVLISTEFASMNSVPMAIDESFLLLFFKKEVLFFFLFLFVYLGSYKAPKNFSPLVRRRPCFSSPAQGAPALSEICRRSAYAP